MGLYLTLIFFLKWRFNLVQSTDDGIWGPKCARFQWGHFFNEEDMDFI
jgi:hypothetical protein